MIRRKQFTQVYQPQNGDRVVLVYDDDNTWGPGTVVRAGEEQSLWRADKDRQERCTINTNLRKIKR